MIAFAVLAKGCGSTCNSVAMAIAATHVTVVDATTGAPICNASVTLTAGSDQEVLMSSWVSDAGVVPEAGTACDYSGGFGVNTDHFTLTVGAPGYQTQRKQVAVGPLVQCGQEHATRHVTFKLTPGA